jgi:hypothetical protein
MSSIDRSTPPLDADEGTTPASWLDFYRATLADRRSHGRVTSAST